jgi:(p)ppGpp synthase/HD superfamily hydrolase
MRVDKHLVDLADNARAGIKTEAKKLEFGQTVAKSKKQIESETQKELLNTNRISGIIAEPDPKTALKNSMSYLKTLADNGEISNEQYVNFLNQANQIDFAKPEAARRALKNISIAVAGAAGAGAIGTSILRNNTNPYQ